MQKVIATFNQVCEHNMFEQRQGQTLTPLLMGKIQFGKLKKAYNLDAIRKECLARGLQFDNSTNWKSLISMIKNHEKDNKYFKPLTNYNSFKWNASHFNKNGEVTWQTTCVSLNSIKKLCRTAEKKAKREDLSRDRTWGLRPPFVVNPAWYH